MSDKVVMPELGALSLENFSFHHMTIHENALLQLSLQEKPNDMFRCVHSDECFFQGVLGEMKNTKDFDIEPMISMMTKYRRFMVQFN